MFFGVVYGIVSPYYYYKMYFLLWILLVDIAIETISDLDENKEIFVMGASYLTIWTMIVLVAVTGFEARLQAKRPTLFDTCRAPALAGIYYTTNVEGVLNINASCLVDANRVKLAEAMGKIEDITLKNMMVGGMNTNCKAWMYVISRAESGDASINDLQYAVVETKVEDFLKDESKKYFVLYTSDKYETTEDYELVFQNEAGVILRKLEK